MDTTPSKRAKVVALSENTEMSVRQIVDAVYVTKSSVSRIVLSCLMTQGASRHQEKDAEGQKGKLLPGTMP